MSAGQVSFNEGDGHRHCRHLAALLVADRICCRLRLAKQSGKLDECCFVSHALGYMTNTADKTPESCIACSVIDWGLTSFLQ